MITHELEAVYRLFPFLKNHIGEGEIRSITVEESPGGLDEWKAVEERCNDYYDRPHLAVIEEIILLDENGEKILQVGARNRWHPPKKILWWTIDGYTTDELFEETVGDALRRAEKPVCFILKTWAGGATFTLYKPPAGKTFEEWGREKDRRTTERRKEEQTNHEKRLREENRQRELKVLGATETLLAKIQEIDAAGQPPMQDPPTSSVN